MRIWDALHGWYGLIAIGSLYGLLITMEHDQFDQTSRSCFITALLEAAGIGIFSLLGLLLVSAH
jgi:hypothetical protein